MTHPPDPGALWGERTLDRARRWLERIRRLVGGAIATVVPDAVRLDIEDFVAAALGEATEVLEKAKTQLEATYTQRGESKRRAQELARAFLRDWLRSRPRSIMPGMLAVRQLDVHVEARYSGRMIQIQPPGSKPPEKVWWTHPAIPKAQHDLLRPSSQLSDEDLAAFNQYMQGDRPSGRVGRGVVRGECVPRRAREGAGLIRAACCPPTVPRSPSRWQTIPARQPPGAAEVLMC